MPLARSRNGIHELLDFETARAVAQSLTDVHEALDNGGGVSGAAARRLINAAGTQHRRFGGLVTTTRHARSLLADPALNVFHNSEAFLFCNYDRAKTLCHPSRGAQTTPSLDRCRPNCANIARTDEHASQIENAATELRAQASSPLLPDRSPTDCGRRPTTSLRSPQTTALPASPPIRRTHERSIRHR